MNEETPEQTVDEILAETPEETETPQTNEEVVEPKPTQEEKPEKDKEFQSIEAQKQHFKTKAERLEKQLNANKVGGTDPMEVVKLAKALEGRTEDEIDFITRNAATADVNDIIAASKDEWVKDAIDTRRKKTADKNKIPGSSSPDYSQPSKDYQDIKKMSKDEFRAYAEKQERGGNTGV